MRSLNEYTILEHYTILKVTSNKFGDIQVIIDTEDLSKVQQYRWYAHKQRTGKFYIINRKNKLQLHRLVMNTPKDLIVDHINGDTLDNRKCNLRNCDHSTNNRNKKFTDSNVGVKYIHKHIKNNKEYYYVNVQKIGFKNNTFSTLDRAIKYLQECNKGLHRKEKSNG